MSSYHLMNINDLDAMVIKRPLKRGRLLVSPPVFSQPPPPPHYRLP